jgi:hypothetical protein
MPHAGLAESDYTPEKRLQEKHFAPASLFGSIELNKFLDGKKVAIRWCILRHSVTRLAIYTLYGIRCQLRLNDT